MRVKLLVALVACCAAGPGAVAHADDWTTYAFPNDLRDIARVDRTLWIATTGGALRYDLDSGAFTQFPRRLSGGPVSQDLSSVCHDPVNGLVYFGSFDAGVSQYAPAENRWRRFDELPNLEIRDLACLSGRLYVATAAGFSVRQSLTRTDLCNEIDRGCCGPGVTGCDFPSFDVRSFGARDTTVWAITGSGPAEFVAGRWQPRGVTSLPDGVSIAGIAGEVWVARGEPQGTYRWNAGAGAWDRLAGGLPGGSALGEQARLVVTGETLYLCAQPGLFRLSGSDWISEGLETSVRSVVDVDGTLYACTRDGLRRKEAGGWATLLADGPPLNISGQAVTAASDGTIWIGTLGGAMGLGTDGNWRVARTGQNGLDSSDIFSIFADRTDRLWFGKCCCRNPPSCPTQFLDGSAVSAALGAYDGWGMSEDSGGRLWIGSNSGGVYVLEPSGQLLHHLTAENTGQQIRSTSVRVTATDGARVWLGYEDVGLSILDTKGAPANIAGYGWRYLSGTSGSQLPDATISDIAVVGNDDVWVLTSANLVRFEDGVKTEQIALNSDGEPRRGNGLVVDGDGTKWVGTNNGVLRVASNGGVTVLNTANSDLITNEILDVDRDPRSGDLLFATRIGTSRLRPGVESGGGGGDGVYAYPNPFQANGSNRLKFGLAEADNGEVFDLVGRPVARFALADGWDGRDATGNLAAPGVYLVVVDGTILRVALVR